MAKEAHPSFEVAAIKLSDPASHRQGFSTEGHRVTLHGETVISMMMFAYGIHHKQIEGSPEWAGNDRYDVTGVADAEGEPDTKQLQEMVQKLLAERFGLKFHHDRKELAYYAITLAKGGPKLAKSADQDGGSDQTGNGNGKQMEMKFTNNTMPEFALGLTFFEDRPVVDETGMQGRYDFTLRWQPNETAATEGDGPPLLFTAMEEQLGLKLEPKKGLVDVLVVDRVQRPSAN
jgi:uncharacterized protein (TIGR03435 family)